ncbi:unnamed protein product [Anisakis simplex]|uniref:GMC_OxRdtase_N domain-containing protein n=1 Tax=Anisakis simplex TaxID=6269 RepID=A0A0M3JQB7_ANISI|nr:unnamed protein product [Anisakis simplex]
MIFKKHFEDVLKEKGISVIMLSAIRRLACRAGSRRALSVCSGNRFAVSRTSQTAQYKVIDHAYDVVIVGAGLALPQSSII